MKELEKLQAVGFNFLLVDNIVYATPRKFDGGNYKKKLKKIFSDGYLISELNNFEYESEVARDWCIAKTTLYNVQLYNDNNQEELRDKLNRIDEFEEYLKNNLVNDNGGSYDQAKG